MGDDSQVPDVGTTLGGQPSKNPFTKHDPRHDLWDHICRSERESLLTSTSELWAKMPAEDASPEEFLRWILDLWAARFDSAAAVLVSPVQSHDAADACGHLLDKVKEATLADAIKTRPYFLRAKVFQTEVGIRLFQRHTYWVGLALKNAREAEEKRRSRHLGSAPGPNEASGEGPGMVTQPTQTAAPAKGGTETPAGQNDGIVSAKKNGAASRPTESEDIKRDGGATNARSNLQGEPTQRPALSEAGNTATTKKGIAEEAMEPLVDLPPEATARLRAKEAKANEQYSLVKQAFERDAAKAIAEWGSYVDLFKDNLNDALETTRAGIDEIGLLCAQFVFVAHSVEYRRVVRDPGELQDVLARLREAAIRQYGEHTRASVQCKEAEEMEKALTDGNGETGSSGTIGAEAPVQGAKKRGRRSNPERREAIRKAIEKHGEDWRNHLNEIFTELDSQDVPLGDFEGTKIDLGDGQTTKASSWGDLDLAQGAQRRQILDTLRKYPTDGSNSATDLNPIRSN
jgi:hypothetical protein